MITQSVLRVLIIVIAPAILLLKAGRAPSLRPQLLALDPQTASPGEIVTAHGANLDRTRVAELILEGNEATTLAHIVEQRPELIMFLVPRSLKAGQYRIVLIADTRWGTERFDQDILLTVITADRPIS